MKSSSISSFSYETAPVSFEKLLEILYPFTDDDPLVSVPDHDASVFHLDDLRVGVDIHIFLQRFFEALEGLVGLEFHSVGIEDQRVARDAGRFLVCFAEAAVDDVELAV